MCTGRKGEFYLRNLKTVSVKFDKVVGSEEMAWKSATLSAQPPRDNITFSFGLVFFKSIVCLYSVVSEMKLITQIIPVIF